MFKFQLFKYGECTSTFPCFFHSAKAAAPSANPESSVQGGIKTSLKIFWLIISVLATMLRAQPPV